MNSEIVFGNRVKDLVTGFEGIVTGQVEYMNGCKKWSIDGKYNSTTDKIENMWLDQQQVVKVDDGITKALASKKQDVGGPSRTPPRM